MANSFSSDWSNNFSNKQKQKTMNKEQILTAIQTAIAGQGNQVDAGGVLAEILMAIAGGAVALEVTDITALTGEQLDALNCGDKVVKVTGKQKHAYIVSYKGEGVGEGLCLTYVDASVAETVSYDNKVTGWEYNSTDSTPLGA